MSKANVDSAARGVTFTLDGREIEAREGETIWQAAARHGTDIPHLCYRDSDGYRADGNCRACMVEIEGERVLAASCIRTPTDGMVVNSDNHRAKNARKMVMELLVADQPPREAAHDPESELWRYAESQQVEAARFPARPAAVPDDSHPAIAVNMDACIQCNLCVRACREVQVNDVIGLAGRGADARIVFDFDDDMGASTCVGCGECVQACPTGALMPKTLLDSTQALAITPDRQVDSVCPYCGVGCQLTFSVKDETIVAVSGRQGPANQSRLCVKGRYGFDYIHNPERLTTPLIRREDVPKSASMPFDPANPLTHFREASWDEALDLAAGRLAEVRDTHGAAAMAGFGSAKGTNEEAYLVQKLVRTGFRTNNVDHCTRLCHASSVAALLENIGSGAVTASFAECRNAEAIIVIGANPTVNHPVAATFIKNAAKAGTRLYVLDPRGQHLDRYATASLRFTPGSDVAMLNAMINVIIAEKLYDSAYVESQTEGFEELKARTARTTPEAMAPICGIEPEVLREVARGYATAGSAMIFWGMGISQHTHGTDNSRCLISLALLTGNVGRAGTGLHPLRGQNNVQGASDAGLIPMFFPDYKPVTDAETRARYADFWGAELDPERGLTVVEITDAAYDGDIKAMYIMGENPAMSDPDQAHARAALANLDILVVQDIFMTETAAFADVILPASAFPEKDGTVTNTDRRVQMGRQAVSPPGDARQDWWIIQELARRMGLGLELHASARRLRRNADGHALADRHHLAAASRRGRGDLSLRRRDKPRPRGYFRRRLPDRERARAHDPGRGAAARRDARRRIPDRADHRPSPGALAYRIDDAPLRRSGRHRAGAGGAYGAGNAAEPSGRGRRACPCRHPPRRDRAGGADRPEAAERADLRSLLLLRGAGELPDQSGARSVRQDPGTEVRRGADRGAGGE